MSAQSRASMPNATITAPTTFSARTSQGDRSKTAFILGHNWSSVVTFTRLLISNPVGRYVSAAFW